jgi:hypothetical protein
LKKTTLSILVLSTSLILTVFIQFSSNIDASNTTNTALYHSDKAANPREPLNEVNGSTTSTKTRFDIPELDDQRIDEQPNETSCYECVDSNESCERVPWVPRDENVVTPTPIPDGRIFTRGELPYGYLPTCGPKSVEPPLVPVEMS